MTAADARTPRRRDVQRRPHAEREQLGQAEYAEQRGDRGRRDQLAHARSPRKKVESIRLNMQFR